MSLRALRGLRPADARMLLSGSFADPRRACHFHSDPPATDSRSRRNAARGCAFSDLVSLANDQLPLSTLPPPHHYNSIFDRYLFVAIDFIDASQGHSADSQIASYSCA